MDQYALIVALLTGSIGGMLFIVGSIFSAIVALGNKQYVFGWSVILLLPVSLLYCALNWNKSAYAGKMVYTGTGLLLVTLVVLQVSGII